MDLFIYVSCISCGIYISSSSFYCYTRQSKDTFSDNGTNFVGKECIWKLNCKEIVDVGAVQRIIRRFSLPAAP